MALNKRTTARAGPQTSRDARMGGRSSGYVGEGVGVPAGRLVPVERFIVGRVMEWRHRIEGGS